jgi:hypothetical protein
MEGPVLTEGIYRIVRLVKVISVIPVSIYKT